MNIFISYSNKSRPIVESLATDLEALGYTVWFDSKLAGGHDWWTEILNSIKRCNLFIFALTPESLESHACRLEYEYGLALNKRVLPIMLSDVNIALLPTALQRLQIIDYRLQDKQQAMALSKALINLPPTKPLPKPLPPKPDAPISPIAKLRDQVDARTLSPDDQQLMLLKLKELMESEDTVADAKMLLRRLQERDDLLAKVAKEINGLLEFKRKGKNTQTLRRTLLEPLNLTGHSEVVFSAAFSPDSRKILSGSADQTVRLWDAVSGEELHCFAGHTGSVWNVAFSPNGRMAVSCGRDQVVRLWDIVNGNQLGEFVGHTASVWGVAFAPDGRTLLTGSFDKTVRLWEVKTGRELFKFEGHTAAVWGVSFALDGRTVLSGSWDKTVRLWNVETRKLMREFKDFQNPVIDVTYAPNGQTILVSEKDSMARIFDAVTGKETVQLLGHTAFSIAYAPDGRTVLTGGSDHTARLWNAKSGKEMRQFTGHTDAVTGVTYSPDGCNILTSSADKTIRVWAI